MFADGGIFSAPAEECLTQKAVKAIQSTGNFQFVDNGRCVSAVLSRPDIASLQEFAKEIHRLLLQFFDAHFPMHEHVNAFMALDLEADLPWRHRKELVHSLAIQEGMPKAELWCLCWIGLVPNFLCAGLFGTNSRKYFVIQTSNDFRMLGLHARKASACWLRFGRWTHNGFVC